MPEYLSPGVYIEEKDSGPRPIEGVGTACAAFVGFAPSGPVFSPELVTNWTQFVEKFGALEEGGQRNPYIKGAYLAHAVAGYFANGGGRCYVARVIPPGAARDEIPNAVQFFADPKENNGTALLTVQAKGTPAADITVEVTDVAAPPDATFTLTVRMGNLEEKQVGVSLRDGKGKKVVQVFNQSSRLVTLTEASPTEISGPVRIEAKAKTIDGRPLKPLKRLLEKEAAALLPAAASAESTGEPQVKSSKSSKLSAQSPDKLTPDNFYGEARDRTGIMGLAMCEDVTMVCCPDLLAAAEAGLLGDENAGADIVKAVQKKMIEHCELMGDRLAILDTPRGLDAQRVKLWRDESGYDSKYAAMYYPWIKLLDPNTGEKIAIPPSGHIAGIYARNDNERGVHKAPANEVVRGGLEADTQITKGEQDILNPIGVNCIRSFTGRGLRVWGARTLSSDPAWRYVNVRRLFNFVEKSIEHGTQWVVFEPNDPDLWARVRRDVGAFLTGVWRNGALFGITSDEAFFVRCDEELNPPDVRNRGQLIIEVGLAPVKPAEFVIFRLSQFSGGGA